METQMNFQNKDVAALMLAGTTIVFGAAASGADAQYPQQPITLVVGFPPGGGADALARVISMHMTDELGQKVVIEYRPGAAGNIGAEATARAASNGYTLYLASRPNTIHKSMYKDIKYDFSKDLEPVGLLATMPFVMVTGKDLPVESPLDIVEFAKANPGKLTCASTGIGTNGHLLCELLQQEAGIELMHVPYRGSAAAMTDLMAGRIDILMTALPGALPHITAGTLKAAAVMAPRRAPAIMHIPTMGEYGLMAAYGESWFGLMAPTGTPPHVVARLNSSINAAWANPVLQESMAQIAYAGPMQPNTPEAFGKLIADETDRWTEVLRQRNIQAPN
jgi:tripartite-type tricarboxylate transporter receptor subunit TctC